MKKAHQKYGLVALGLGGVLLLSSFYIKGQVSSGREQIESGQESVNSVNSLFRMTGNQSTGDRITHSAQRKIEAGTAEADHYENVANSLMTAGFILIIIGVALIVFP
jgi:hypothetical protein